MVVCVLCVMENGFSMFDGGSVMHGDECVATVFCMMYFLLYTVYSA